MRKCTFTWLCDQLKNELPPSINQLGVREPISVQKQVAVCVYFLSSCCEYRVVGNVFGIHKSTVWKCIHKVVDVINTKLLHQWIFMPKNDECQTIAALFERRTNIPQLIGAIDGSHIPILPPSDGYRDYINRKGWPSMVLQAVVNNTYKFRNIFCGEPGACHDAAVFKKSNLYKNHDSLIPYQTKVVLNRPIPYLIMGDSAYPLLDWLIKGYTKSTQLTPQ
ncbi:protein ALP1-like [Ooceraea biroi]|uniref:protein ALP1-like n=1 Tax=Ooceraea biroi TaxID=2015173 RepID=UPI000F082305|nr:protein ALP1-like [Ooceraea biroi]